MKEKLKIRSQTPFRNGVTMSEIISFSRKIVELYKPHKIVLFGSYAYGQPGEDSDVDILVILPFKGKSVYKAAEISLRTHPFFPIDLLVYTPEKVRERLRIGDSFFREILDKGKTLHEATD